MAPQAPAFPQAAESPPAGRSPAPKTPAVQTEQAAPPATPTDRPSVTRVQAPAIDRAPASAAAPEPPAAAAPKPRTEPATSARAPAQPPPVPDPSKKARQEARASLAFKPPQPAPTLRVPVGVHKQDGQKALRHPAEHLSFYGIDVTVFSDGSETWRLPQGCQIVADILTIPEKFRERGDAELAPPHERSERIRLPLRDGFRRQEESLHFPATATTAGRFFSVEYREEEDGTHLTLPAGARIDGKSLVLPLPMGGSKIPSGGPGYQFRGQEIVVPLPEGTQHRLVLPRTAAPFGEPSAVDAETQAYFGIRQVQLPSGNILLQLPRSALLAPGRISLPEHLATRGDPEKAPPHVINDGRIVLPLPEIARVQGRNVLIPREAWDDFFRGTASYFGIEEVEGFDGSLELRAPEGSEVLPDRIRVPRGKWNPEDARDTAPPYRLCENGAVEVHLPQGCEIRDLTVAIPAKLVEMFVELPITGDPNRRLEYLGITETRYDNGSIELELPGGSKLDRGVVQVPPHTKLPEDGPDYRITLGGIKLRLPEQVWQQGDRVLIEAAAAASFSNAEHLGFGLYLLPTRSGPRLLWPHGTQRVGRRLLIPDGLEQGQEPRTLSYQLLDDGKAVVQLPAGLRPAARHCDLPDACLAGFLKRAYEHRDGRTTYPALPPEYHSDAGGTRVIWAELAEADRRHLPFPSARSADGRVVMALPSGLIWHPDGSFTAPAGAEAAAPRTDDLPLARLDPSQAEVSALDDGGVLIELPQRMRPAKESGRPPTVLVALKRGLAFSRGAFVHGFLASEGRMVAELRVGNLVYELELEGDGQTKLYHPDGLVEAFSSPATPTAGDDATWPLPLQSRLWQAGNGLPHLVKTPRPADPEGQQHDLVETQSYQEFLSICRELVQPLVEGEADSVIGSVGSQGLVFGNVLEQLRQQGGLEGLLVEVEASRGGELEMVVSPGQEKLTALELVSPWMAEGDWTAGVAATLVERHGHGATPEIEGWVRRYASGEMEVRASARLDAPVLDTIGAHTVGSLEMTADALAWLVEREPELGLAAARRLAGERVEELLDSSDALAEIIEV